MLKYCFSLNFFSKLSNCCVVKGVLGFLFGLCFLKLHFNLGASPLFESKQTNEGKTLDFIVIFIPASEYTYEATSNRLYYV